ncbi:LysR family transcriptional regulator [Burkholderia sp. FXe9]|nr:LysR family transcriptional regulator [Burkholderia sp. FXe9]
MSSMHEVDLRAVDLNLLKLLDALLKERSVTRAGVRLGLTQPAASRALGRLRTLLDDRVVVRTPKGLEFTPRAASLALRVSRVLAEAASIVAPAEFDPATARGEFSIASLDHMALTLIPDVNARLEQRAPAWISSCRRHAATTSNAWRTARPVSRSARSTTIRCPPASIVASSTTTAWSASCATGIRCCRRG